VNTFFENTVPPHLQDAGLWQIRQKQHYYRPLHNHPDRTEVLLVIEGKGEYVINGVSYPIEPNSLVIYNDSVWHEEKSDSNCNHSILYVRFSGLKLPRLRPGFLIDERTCPVIPLKERYFKLEQRFREIFAYYDPRIPESQWICDHLLSVLLAEITHILHFRPGGWTTSPSRNAVEQVKWFIQEHYPEPLTLADLAQSSHLSPFYFSRIFKEETGISPMHFLMRYRLEISKRHLERDNETIDRIASLVGYESGTHFQNLFRRMNGMTPGQYRTKMRKQYQLT
jgi:AraC-like DNA-binding protein